MIFATANDIFSDEKVTDGKYKIGAESRTAPALVQALCETHSTTARSAPAQGDESWWGAIVY